MPLRVKDWAQADPAGKHSLAEAAYRSLRFGIVECRLAPGQRLTEAGVAAELGVGKTPAREALHRLVMEGLARVIPRHGYAVAPITLRDVEELFSLRLLVEPGVAALAAGNLDPAALAGLRKLSFVGYGRGVRASVRSFVHANTEFHAQIAHLTGNRRIAQLVSQLLVESERLINFSAPLHPQSERTVKEHRGLLAALAGGDRRSARRIAEEHIRATRRMVLDSLISDEGLRNISIGRPGLRPLA